MFTTPSATYAIRFPSGDTSIAELCGVISVVDVSPVVRSR